MSRMSRTMRRIGAIVLVLGIAALGVGLAWQTQHASPRPPAAAPAIHKIQHVVVVMQENRSFDHYFGTYPGADGIPMKNGVPTVCLPNPKTKTCNRPYHIRADLNLGGPHGAENIAMVENGGKMDGFITAVVTGGLHLLPNVGNLMSDFDCTQQPRPPLVLPTHPKTDLVALPAAPGA